MKMNSPSRKYLLTSCLTVSIIILVGCDFQPSEYTNKIYTGREPILSLDIDNKMGKSLYIESLSEGWTINITGNTPQIKSKDYIGTYGEFLQINVREDSILNIDDLERKKSSIIKVLGTNLQIKANLDRGIKGLELHVDRDDHAARDFISKRDSILPMIQQQDGNTFDYALYLEGYSNIKALLDNYLDKGMFYPTMRLSFLQEALRSDCLSEQEALDYFRRYIDSSGRVEGRMSHFITTLNKQPLKGIGHDYKADGFYSQDKGAESSNSNKDVQIAIDFSAHYQSPITNDILEILNELSMTYNATVDFIGIKCNDCNERPDTYSVRPSFSVIKVDHIFNDRLNYIYPEETGPRVVLLNGENQVLLNTHADDHLSAKIDGVLAYLYGTSR